MNSLEITGMSFAVRRCVCNANAVRDYKHGFLDKVKVNGFMQCHLSWICEASSEG